MNKKHILTAAALALGSLSAMAADENLIAVSFGHVGIHSTSPDLTSNGPAFLTPQPAGVDVGDSNTVLISVTRSLNEHWSIELAAGIPPKHNVYGRGMLAPFGATATVKQFAPTVLANYSFGSSGDAFRPYVGVGVNYTKFFDANSTPAGDLATGGPTKIDLSSSKGLAGVIGMKYRFQGSWYLTGQIATANIKTSMTATTGSVQRMTRVTFNPLLISMGLAYSF